LKLVLCLVAGQAKGSHPVRVRGLKHCQTKTRYATTPSHPVRVRGLKLVLCLVAGQAKGSHPVRVRGLKHLS